MERRIVFEQIQFEKNKKMLEKMNKKVNPKTIEINFI